MTVMALPVAAHFLTGSILSLVLPLGVLVIVAVWYSLRWHRRAGEPERPPRSGER
jgi:hypothetical protein